MRDDSTVIKPKARAVMLKGCATRRNAPPQWPISTMSMSYYYYYYCILFFFLSATRSRKSVKRNFFLKTPSRVCVCVQRAWTLRASCICARPHSRFIAEELFLLMAIIILSYTRHRNILPSSSLRASARTRPSFIHVVLCGECPIAARAITCNGQTCACVSDNLNRYGNEVVLCIV